MHLETFVDVIEDLHREMPAQQRYARLLDALRTAIPSDAIALLRLQGTTLQPLVSLGLKSEFQGRRFKLDEHPRLAAILSARTLVRFASDSDLPDPYDGLVHTEDGELHVHDCMGFSIYLEEQPWGLITHDALRAGQFDDIDPVTLKTAVALSQAVIHAAARIAQLEQQLSRGRDLTSALLEEQGKASMVGSSPAIDALQADMRVVSQSDLTVLITGETGVGKELVARQIHDESLRRRSAMVHINCAALPESVVESELFGHVKGAFTGAIRDRRGRFELADGGTLFLDEVGELPPTVQSKLLRALQEGEIQPVGSEETVSVNVRIIAATNRDLAVEVREQRFRADLFHRLSVYPIEVPPLRQRDTDVLELAGFFLERDQHRLGHARLRLHDDCTPALIAYSWPGNVRELEHVISRAALKAIAAAPGQDLVQLRREHLDLGPGYETPDSAGNIREAATSTTLDLKAATQDFQRRTIASVLRRCDNNIAAAARVLNLDRSNLLRLARRLGLR